jgi:Domain of unknown function (DUF4384)/Putative zinc-finger
MFSQMKQQRPAQCVSDLRFDAFAAGELEEAARRELQQHVTTCARCQSRERALAGFRERFDAQRPGRVPAVRSAGTGASTSTSTKMSTSASGARAKLGGSRNGWWLGASLAAAATALLAFNDLRTTGFQTRPLPHSPTPTLRAKGSEHIAFFLKRGDQVQRGAREQRVQPGDQLRFLYTAPRTRYLAIVSLDGAREASVFYPASERAARIEPGVDVALPSAVELDGALGEERVYALFCDAPVELAFVRTELVKRGEGFAAPAGCVMDEVVLRREGGSETGRDEEGRR